MASRFNDVMCCAVVDAAFDGNMMFSVRASRASDARLLSHRPTPRHDARHRLFSLMPD
jgi:hypothetical protein